MAWPTGRQLDGGLDEIVIDGEGVGIWLCGKHLIGPDPEAALARVAGAPVTVVCLCQRPEFDERYPAYLEWLTTNADDRALWRPIPDLTAPPADEAASIAAEINVRLDGGDQVLIHCAAGMGRAPTMAACALIVRGHAVDDVLAAIAACRPLAGPETGDQADLVRGFGQRFGK